ncbi:MAG: porin [Oxalicibacterium faecigallinarum]|uniref:porin n=1 Tax=Oxalicibacterium faecigallinarum TaxID=573741 RepID=UPI002807349A|nr:porin [Oxalicibacterium faecigallinarum]MDQ7968921.1 porin [Oxalicibacterium faecigallinarum]
MKKSLLALAVLGAFAGAASAQSSVTVYGIVDVGVTSIDNGTAAGRINGIDSGNQSASRLGFKGTEDLGGGLNALFQLESTIAADTGTFGGFNRIAIVGLQSANFGTVTLGRQTNALKDAYDQIDPFGDGGVIGGIGNFFFNGSGLDVSNTGNVAIGAYNGRVNNSIKYASPSFGGFKATANYAFGENASGSTGDNSSYGLGLGYANGPLNVQFGYNDIDASRTAAGAVIANTLESKIAFIGATYNFGAFKLHGAYADTKADYTTTANQKIRNGMVGVSVPLGAGTILATYSINDNRSTADADARKAAVMYTYDLSKRTNLYTGYSRVSNDTNSTIGNTAAVRAPAGEDTSAFTVGIRHKF